MNRVENLRLRFLEVFGRDCAIFQAPGRVNLIGEHTDYNDGFVMPAAIAFSTLAATAPRHDRVLRVRSENIGETIEFALDSLVAKPTGHWSDYVRGVAGSLEESGYKLAGVDMLLDGNVPLGAGLSSSASIEVAAGIALEVNSGLRVKRRELALAAQRAEHVFVGTRCGIMDQFISCFGKAGHALMLDCRSLDFELLPLSDEVRLVICNSMVKHELASGEYNQRRADCERGVQILQQHLPGVGALRDVTAPQLEKYRDDMPDLVYRRCRHVVSENERVQRAAAALNTGELGIFGELMAESHRSLRDDYDVSCAELDQLVDLAAAQRGVYGARMTGGGFGGCTINLVRSDAAEEFARNMKSSYGKLIGREPNVYISSAADGAKQID